MSYRNLKVTFFKYFLLFLCTIGLWLFLFFKTAPKAAELAKNEVLENVFNIKISNDTINRENNDSLIKTSDTINDTSLIAIPIEVSEHSAHIMAKVNGVDMRFMIDTGCSTIQLTSAEFFHLKHLGLISESDIVDETVCTYADNSSQKCKVVKLKNIIIGGIEIKNVKAVIQENADASLLLGQSILKQLGEVSINYDEKKMIIKKS